MVVARPIEFGACRTAWEVLSHITRQMIETEHAKLLLAVTAYVKGIEERPNVDLASEIGSTRQAVLQLVEKMEAFDEVLEAATAAEEALKAAEVKVETLQRSNIELNSELEKRTSEASASLRDLGRLALDKDRLVAELTEESAKVEALQEEKAGIAEQLKKALQSLLALTSEKKELEGRLALEGKAKFSDEDQQKLVQAQTRLVQETVKLLEAKQAVKEIEELKQEVENDLALNIEALREKDEALREKDEALREKNEALISQIEELEGKEQALEEMTEKYTRLKVKYKGLKAQAGTKEDKPGVNK